ncbi:maleylpyruvate isomerase N-terminal domain-containing protein [Kitasatospora sp. NPDC093806]|uniref:maleylpyruvate isomerase N-terminal domain-containing protein n=1 Tax=Kitasatospora sp. NPDC093806 TaxID=3155075 RepID=UPI00341E947E
MTAPLVPPAPPVSDADGASVPGPLDWPALVTDTAAVTTTLLAEAAGADWTRSPEGSEWTCRATLDHLALGVLGYAGLLTARPTDRYITLFGSLDPAAPVEHCLEGVRIAAALLAGAVREAPADARAWHPWGHSDGPGFAAMGITELLVHTWDLAGAFGLDRTPDWALPERLAAPALARLFPDAPTGFGAGATLLWCTGRVALSGLARKAAGQWQWDGRVGEAGSR